MNQPGDQSGAEYLQLALSGTAAGQIADLQSLLGDIQFARDCAQHYVDLPPDADLVRRALWTASCIAYRRVFTSGKGHLNPKNPRLRPNQNFTAALTTEQLKAHDEVLAIANKHIAHRVGELEQVMVLALLNPSPMPRAVAGVGTMVVHMAAPANEVIQSFITVFDLLLGSTAQECQRLCEGAKQHLQQQDINAMYEQVGERERKGQGKT
jgi:hypothetical protein